MKKLFARADREGGGFFAMKRAQAHEIGAAFFQAHIATHHFDNVGASDQLLDESLWNCHGLIRR